MKILLVDDEIELTEPLLRVLRREGYEVDVASEGHQGNQLAHQGDYDLLILDWMLPGQTGLEICQQVRDRGQTTPVLFLTAKDTIDDRVQGLDAGADDYLVKPFELRELLARVRALLRRPTHLSGSGTGSLPSAEVCETSNCLQVEDLILDRQNQVAHRGKRAIELSEKESQLLEYLMLNAGQLLTHSQIHQHLWAEGEQPASNALAAQVRLLRRKIEAWDEEPLIHTVYGKGYRLGIEPSKPNF